jgi:arabinose-5-phosphate isomerase
MYYSFTSHPIFLGILLIVLSLIAVPSLILSKKPNAKELLDKIAPFQGWIGIFFCLWGLWNLIWTLMQLGIMQLFGIWGIILWVTYLAYAAITCILGFMLGYNLIVEYVHHRGGKLVTSGMGKAGQIAQNIATTFSSTGTPSVFLHPSEAQHGDLGILQKNDIILLISNSGKTREIMELIDLSRILNEELKFIGITGDEDSPLATKTDICLFTGNPKEVCNLGLTPTTSTTVLTVIGDVLVVDTMKKIDFKPSEYAKRHHGGYLGDKSRELNNFF